MSHLSRHLYEYKRGVRRMVLHTASLNDRDFIEKKLTKEGIAYHIVPLSKRKINVFFGEASCIQVVRYIDKPRLCDYTPEEDFLLGTMLGYDLLRQCDRYLDKKQTENQNTRPPEAKSPIRYKEVQQCR